MSDSGRFYVIVEGRKFCVEPIDNSVGKRKQWGDVDVVTKKTTGDYGEKHRGAIHESDSIITEGNGFKNIVTLPGGVSPLGYIAELVEKSKK